MSRTTGSKKIVYAALAGNLLVALTKTAAGLWTGSAAMQSEAVHSFVDTGNEVLLLYGYHRAARAPDSAHPLGYGREIYFWSFVVSLMVFALGAGVSLFQGVAHIRHPEPIEDPIVSYVVLLLSLIFEGASWWIALRKIRNIKGALSYYEHLRASKDPPSFMVLLEDTAALAGIIIAAIGIFLATTLKNPLFDGLASVLIGLLLAVTAILLARESKSLLIGEQADPQLTKSVLKLVTGFPSVFRANGLTTIQLSPNQIVAALSVEFSDELNAPSIEEEVIAIERAVRENHPEIVALFVKPQTQQGFGRRFFPNGAP